MYFPERVLAVSMVVVMALVLFCGGHAWAQKETLSKVDDTTAAITTVMDYPYDQLAAEIQQCDDVIAQQDNAVAQYAKQAEEIKKPWIERRVKLLDRQAWMDAQGIKPVPVEVKPE